MKFAPVLVPVVFKVMVALLPQVNVCGVAMIAEGNVLSSITVILAEDLQPFEGFVTETVYVPPVEIVKFGEVAPPGVHA